MKLLLQLLQKIKEIYCLYYIRMSLIYSGRYILVERIKKKKIKNYN